LAKQGLKRMFLHAGDLEFAHPLSGETVKLHVPLPEDLSRFLLPWQADALLSAGVRLDGTLIDSADAIVRCIQSACRDLGLPVPDDARASHVIGLGLQDALAYAVPGLPSADYGRIVERYRFHFLARDAAIPLFPGAAAMLAGLRRRGHVLAIATGKSRAGLARALDSTGLRPLFVASRCADQCAPKPGPTCCSS